MLLGLGRPAQRDDRQSALSTVELDVKGEAISRLSGDEHLRLGAGRAAWPVRTWFQAGPTMCG